MQQAADEAFRVLTGDEGVRPLLEQRFAAALRRQATLGGASALVSRRFSAWRADCAAPVTPRHGSLIAGSKEVISLGRRLSNPLERRRHFAQGSRPATR